MKTIIVAIDFSDKTHRLLHEAETMAHCYGNAHVYLIHVAAPEPEFVGYEVGPSEERDFRSNKLHKEKKELEGYSLNLRKSGITTTPLLLQGETSRLLTEQSKHLHASLLIMGTHGKGLAKSVILGSISHDVVKNICCPILLLPCNN